MNKKALKWIIIPEHTSQICCYYSYTYLLSSRLYCRLRSYTESTSRFAGFTAGRKFHPAL